MHVWACRADNEPEQEGDTSDEERPQRNTGDPSIAISDPSADALLGKGRTCPVPSYTAVSCLWETAALPPCHAPSCIPLLP